MDNISTTSKTINPKSDLSGTVPAIASKSHAHRLLIAAALSENETDIILNTTSKDIEATTDCLISLGAKITKTDTGLHVVPINKSSKNSDPLMRDIAVDDNGSSTLLSDNDHTNENAVKALDAGESGSTLRFILPVIAALGESASITTHGRLTERPLSPLYEELEEHGITLSPMGKSPLDISGKMSGGSFIIPGNISSQYITGLLFALPLLDTDSTLTVTGKLESRPYVDITLDVLKEFGIIINEETVSAGSAKTDCDSSADITMTKTIFNIHGSQTYTSAGSYTVEGDWSNAAFFLAAGAISASADGVTVSGLKPSSLQGDKEIIPILSRFGASVRFEAIKQAAPSDNEKKGNGLYNVTVSRNVLSGVDIDAADIPDLVPILSAVAAVSEGTTRISHIERLRIKESDRVATVIETLTNLGADIHEENNSLIINGKPSLSGGTVDSHNDHRIAMTAAILGICCESPVTIQNPNAVAKSYPNFYDAISLL